MYIHSWRDYYVQYVGTLWPSLVLGTKKASRLFEPLLVVSMISHMNSLCTFGYAPMHVCLHKVLQIFKLHFGYPGHMDVPTCSAALIVLEAQYKNDDFLKSSFGEFFRYWMLGMYVFVFTNAGNLIMSSLSKSGFALSDFESDWYVCTHVCLALCLTQCRQAWLGPVWLKT